MKATKVTLRQRLLNSGKITLYLDFYPPFKDPVTKKDNGRVAPSSGQQTILAFSFP